MSVFAPNRPIRRAFSGFGLSTEYSQIEKLEQDIERHYWAPVSRVSPSKRFAELSATWRSDTAFTSSALQMATHPAYQEIIGMGPDALPLILRELAERPAHWFWALTSISGVNPIEPAIRGKFSDMTKAWLDWGRKRGYIE